MNWHLYKKDDPNTWPQIDCPMVVCLYHPNGKMNLWICKWDNNRNCFIRQEICNFYTKECYYAYIGYVPKGYKTHQPAKCKLGWYGCQGGYDDNTYCLYDGNCNEKQIVNEYEIEEKQIWKEFE